MITLAGKTDAYSEPTSKMDLFAKTVNACKT